MVLISDGKNFFFLDSLFADIEHYSKVNVWILCLCYIVGRLGWFYCLDCICIFHFHDEDL